MATISQVRDALRVRLATINGLRASSIEQANPSPPAAWPLPRSGAYNADFEGDTTMQMVVRVVVNMADLSRGQQVLDPYLSPTGTNSIKAAIEADPSLGGVVDSVRVTGWGAYGQYVFGDVTLLGAEINVEIFA